MLTRTRSALGIAALVCAGLLGSSIANAAPAAELRQGQAYTVSANGRSAVVYFTATNDGFTVVATAADNLDGAANLRTVYSLAEGQSVLLQVDGQTDRVMLTRVGDRLQVNPAGVIGS
ncbi:hypothetical protein [Indioceanicola profundi]|uniref:hypothetical protein n=1 Tax=Indioceanicola profundi TaxID=2220096 RepID=UPI000E6AD5D7|nr:hypothetical protein [Indioceanicola profundi]